MRSDIMAAQMSTKNITFSRAQSGWLFREDKTVRDFKFLPFSIQAGHSSSIGSVSAWHASGPKFNTRVQHILSWRLGHEKISTVILPLPLMQEEQLSVTGERMRTKYW